MKRRNIIIWGFANDYHNQRSGDPIASHAYIHAGYEKAFRFLGHDVSWVEDVEKAQQMVAPGDVLFVMDTRSRFVPIRDDCFYVTHNCHDEKFHNIAVEKRLGLQVYSRDACGETINSWTKYANTSKGRTLFQPWATDLLPHQFTYDPVVPKTRHVSWVGSIWKCEFNRGNWDEMQDFEMSLKAHDLSLRHQRLLDSEHIDAIRGSVIAPAVQGQWQCDVSYLPCRLWKNVSYGQMAITNNAAASLLMPSVFAEDMGELVSLSLGVDEPTRLKMTAEAMEIVKTKHTYLNRAKQILDCLFP